MANDDNTPPMAVPIPATPYMMQPTAEQLVRERENAHLTRLLASHDAARAAAPQVTLICVAAFTIVDDDHPDGRVVNRGDEFTISEFDLPRYLGKGLFKGDDPRRNSTHF